MSKALLVQVVGPHEMAVNTGELLGRARAESRLLAHRGWRVLHLAVADLSLTEQDQQMRIAAMLQSEGVVVDSCILEQGKTISGTADSASALHGYTSARGAGLACDVENGSVAGPTPAARESVSKMPHYTSQNYVVPLTLQRTADIAI